MAASRPPDTLASRFVRDSMRPGLRRHVSHLPVRPNTMQALSSRVTFVPRVAQRAARRAPVAARASADRPLWCASCGSGAETPSGRTDWPAAPGWMSSWRIRCSGCRGILSFPSF